MVFLNGEQCFLRTLQEEDVRQMTELVRRNKAYWSIYEPLHPSEYYTEKIQLRKIQESIRQMQMRREYSFGIFLRESQQLIGHISIYSIKRLPFSSAFVGYSLDEQQVGKGIATEALELICRFAFEEIGIHRLEAYVSPKNVGSVRVLEKAKFEQEGLLKQLLYVNGTWEDHYMYALLEDVY